MMKHKIISFKSIPENYRKEKSGIKSNTVRNTLDWDRKRRKLYWDAEYIQICNKNNPKEKFKRVITDKTEFEHYVIISWNSEEGGYDW